MKSVTLFYIFARRNIKGLEKAKNSNLTNIEMRKCLLQYSF